LTITLPQILQQNKIVQNILLLRRITTYKT
jgi:hypothetical protein